MIQLDTTEPERLGCWPFLAAFNATFFGMGAWLLFIRLA